MKSGALIRQGRKIGSLDDDEEEEDREKKKTHAAEVKLSKRAYITEVEKLCKALTALASLSRYSRAATASIYVYTT